METFAGTLGGLRESGGGRKKKEAGDIRSTSCEGPEVYSRTKGNSESTGTNPLPMTD